MEHLKNQYIFEKISLSDFSDFDLQKYCSEKINIEKENLQDIQPYAVEINSGVFYKPSSNLDFPGVAVNLIGSSLIFDCPCNLSKTKMCTHQAHVFFTILERPDLRIFFDGKLRRHKLETIAKEYGLENESNLDDYFQLENIHHTLRIEPKIKELIKLNTDDLKKKLLPENSGQLPEIKAQNKPQKLLLVIRKHKYYDRFSLELFEAETTKSGKIKNPVSEVNPSTMIWRTENIDEAKFFTAISKFENIQNEEKNDTDVEALKMVVKNPLSLPFFYHDPSVSENISAKSIVPVDVKITDAEIELQVFKKEPLFEIAGGLWLNEVLQPFKNIKIQYTYFVFHDKTLHLITNLHMLRVLEFFKANREILLVHSSKFEEFKKNILVNLERQIKINYSYIQPATQKQLAENSFDEKIQKIIYLSDQLEYISVTPVMKYGNIEIPVFSRKQIYDTDQNGNEFLVERDSREEVKFTALIMRQHPDFADQIQEFEYFYLHKNKFFDEDWFLNVFEKWQNENIVVLGFNDLKKNKLNPNKAVVSIILLSGINWFNAEVNVKYGNQKASLKQLHKSIRNKNRFVQLDDGTHGILPEEWIKKLNRYFQIGEINEELLKFPKSSFSEIKNLFDTNVLSEEVYREIEIYDKAFSEEQNIPETEVPSELKATLRDYQKEGLNWLNRLDNFGFGGCLADDMGLGKTLHIIAFILSQNKKHPQNINLVVVPTSLLFNWQAEVEKFAPSIRIFTHYGANRIKNTSHFEGHEIILITYGMLLSDIRFLKDFHFNYIFLDESQAIKNPNSERYKAARLLKSRNRIVLTGTPVENNTFDLYGQLSFAVPGLLGSKQYFNDIYSVPVDQFKNTKRSLDLQQKIKPFILRRTKKQVAKELPDKTEMVIYCEMGAEQRRIYDAQEEDIRNYISGKDEDDISKSSMHVLTGLTKLRQICNSPKLLKDQEQSGDSSAKIDVLMEQIESKSSQHKILIFSQFVSMLDLIKDELEKRELQFEYLTGQTKNRAKKVNDFQENDQIRVFLISLKAGGTGLNLTEADYVYLVDPWWNPAVENQAIDRCYRIGQKKNVIAVRLICKDTVEEKIMKLQQSKKELANDLIATDRSVFKKLSKQDLLELL
ncbi:DNA helicase [Chryseobacterium sp. Leaf404]|uniref:DEAD/DEAH box helicase n=1 Tax=unclassified Chryseobacterium TaxID=2593645 RepID=UPI0006F843B0|nr:MULTISPECIES: DEAD/DEAH box helicase [unclassified Chryseobacterium]KQT16923.1 DNA helicase [Chryseobacterium sp. Leaf404]